MLVGLGSSSLSALVSLVGAGPGDPSLITPSSVLALHHADVVVGDSLVHRALLALAPTASVVDQRAIVRDDALDWAACAHLVCAHARAGKRVCWLLSTSSASRASLAQIAELLQIEGVETEVNPGSTRSSPPLSELESSFTTFGLRSGPCSIARPRCPPRTSSSATVPSRSICN